jgi:membrane protein
MGAELWRLTKAAAAGWWNDRAMSLGAAIAFFTIFSLAPILLASISIAGLAFGQEAARGAVVAELGHLLGPEAASAIEAMIANASNVGSGIIGTAIGAVTFLLLATGAIVELQDDLNLIWKAKPAESYGIMDFVRTRLVSVALVVGFGFLLLVSLVVDAGLSAIATSLHGALPSLEIVLWMLNAALGLSSAVLLFAMVFKILPTVDLTWRDVWIGALGTGVLFTLGKFAIGFYLGTSGIASSYGAAAAIITILLWVYYSSLILLFGAEFTKAFAESRGSHAVRAAGVRHRTVTGAAEISRERH